MSYDSALKAAGCEILEYEYTGSFQGDWYALVKQGGEVGVVRGSYGRCSHCDAFEAEFGYFYERDDHQEKLKEFGESYLPALPIDIEIANLEKSIGDIDWGDEKEALEYLVAWKAKYNL